MVALKGEFTHIILLCQIIFILFRLSIKQTNTRKDIYVFKSLDAIWP